MKTTIFSTLFLAAAVVACDDDGIRVDPVVNDAFHGLYPGVTRVEWERNTDHCVAEFRRGRNDAEAWFTHAGVWCMTETDISYAELPQAVRAAFEQSDYAAWRVDDVDMLEYPDRQTVYVVEVESGNAERDLYYTPDGILFKTRPDVNATAPGNGTGSDNGTDTGGGNGTGGDSGSGTGNGQHTPASVLPAVKAFIAQRYPGALIADVEVERTSIEVDIVDGRTPREVIFTRTGEWTRTETELRRADIPATVTAAIAASQYSAWRVDDAEHHDTPAGEYYLVELESGRREVTLKIDASGNIL